MKPWLTEKCLDFGCNIRTWRQDAVTFFSSSLTYTYERIQDKVNLFFSKISSLVSKYIKNKLKNTGESEI